MTDEQIFENEIKCIIRRNEGVCNGGSDCIKCDLLMDSEEIIKCYNRAIKNIKLNNRQKAEIEEWKKKANTPFAKVTFDRDKLQEIVDECAKNIEIDINLAKSEAIKEFAERLKEKLQWDVEFDNKLVFESDIDSLVKEMTEGNNNG